MALSFERTRSYYFQATFGCLEIVRDATVAIEPGYVVQYSTMFIRDWMVFHRGWLSCSSDGFLNMVARLQSRWEDFLKTVASMTVKISGCGSEEAVTDAIYDH